ncbi:MAG: Crp/Fnr family transcriptional regulator [Moorellales bacterium]
MSAAPNFAHHGYAFRYPRGTVIFVQRDRASKLYLIMEGVVKLSIFSDQGQERIIEFIKPYRFLGAPDVFSGSLYGITAIAYTEVVVAGFTAQQVEELLSRDQEFAIYLAKSLSQHARALGRQLVGDSFYPAVGRVGFALLNLAVQIGADFNGQTISLPITQNELARYVGCNRVTVTKAIADLAEAGLVKKQKKHLLILDHVALRRWLEDMVRV